MKILCLQTEINDSFDDAEPATRGEMIENAKKLKAVYLLVCTESNGLQSAVYVMSVYELAEVERLCWKSCYHVETIDIRLECLREN